MPKRKQPPEDDCGQWGGHRQRHLDTVVDAVPVGHSKLARYLLRQYFTGALSLPLVVEIAMLSVAEPSGHKDMVCLKNLGTAGLYPGNLRRYLYNRLLKFPLEAALQTFEPPVKLFGKLATVDFQLIYPHILFAQLYHH